jgi:hypothetical protein
MPSGFVWFDWVSAKATLVFWAGVLTKSRGAILGFFSSANWFYVQYVRSSERY